MTSSEATESVYGKELARGIVLRQSLRSEGIPKWLTKHVTGQHEHLLGGVQMVDVLELSVHGDDVPAVGMKLSKELQDSGFYTHFVTPCALLVVFPKCIVLVDRGDGEGAERCRRIGASFGLPADQMRFEELFEVDHPRRTQS